ncbi:MAG: hypothetical protein J7L79_00135 [Thaumarchaeota archaeon]|nr:hypothetical protein [Nitrososphaerota archaeon]
MLSTRDFKRIVREIGSVRGKDVIEFLERTSPWFRFFEPALQRASEALKTLNVFHVLYGLRPLPIYGVPYISREMIFAVKLENLNEVIEELKGRGFRKVPSSRERLGLLDLQTNRRIELLPAPEPLEWDDDLIERSFEREKLRFLSAEDYAIALIGGNVSTMRLELAAKTLYANLDSLDLSYLEDRASRLSVKEVLDKLLNGLREASSQR